MTGKISGIREPEDPHCETEKNIINNFVFISQILNKITKKTKLLKNYSTLIIF